jgi:hypothetical protein
MTAPSGFTVAGPSTQALEVRIGDSWQEVLRIQFRDVGDYNIETPRTLPAEATAIRLVTYLSLEAFLALQPSQAVHINDVPALPHARPDVDLET